MSDYGSESVLCPFWKDRQNGNQQEIRCEGISNTTTIKLCFLGHKKGYVQRVCSKDYSACLIYQMLENKYKK